MITLRQLETFYWIVQLGTFERAANKLNTTQSAISKRIQELELASGLPIFDRSQRGARLTGQGESLLVIAGEMLALHERIAQLADSQDMAGRILTVGVTELSAMTWLPRLIGGFRARYPRAEIRPEVGMSRNLLERLQEGSLDLIVVPETLTGSDIVSVALQDVENGWMARPGLVDVTSRPLPLGHLANYPVLVQGRSSGYAQVLSKWLQHQGVVLPRLLSCDSMTALLGLTVAGLGISYLPRHCFQPLIDEGKLLEIATDPCLPRIPYVALFRNDRPSTFAETVAGLAAECCDFTRQFQDWQS